MQSARMGSEHHHPGLSYRRDIDGLRALAVLPILFNHVGVRGFGGGYVGVDIFFVISGFLISNILVRDIGSGRFTLAGFYRRRVLRIFPALFAMLAAVSLLCLPILMPGEMMRFARSALGATFFSSNLVFYSEAGYFDAASHSKPLLHTWSLGIEEQFYLVWPWLLWLAARRGTRATALAMGLVALASFAFALWQVPRDMEGAFYLLPARAWELALGGMVAILPPWRAPRWLSEALSLTGGALIAYAILRFFPPIAFPGLTALVPCLGAALLIRFAPGTLAGRILSLAPVAFIGQISYSLYLWHWPVIVLSEIGLFLRPTPTVMAGQIALSLLLAWLSWRWIEQPFRHAEGVSDRVILRRAAGAMAIALVAGVAMLSGHGLSWRFTPEERRLAAYADRDYEAGFRRGTCFIIAATDHFDQAKCMAQAKGRPELLLVGDSMAAQYWPGLARYRQDFAISQATMAGCRPNLYPADSLRRCESFFRTVILSARARRPAVMILSGNWQQMDMDLLGRSLPEIARLGVPVLLLGPLPQYDASLPRLLVSARRYGQRHLVTDALQKQGFEIDRQMAQMAARNGISYFSPISLLCRGDECRNLAEPDEPLQFDYGHLSPAGSRLVTDAFMPVAAAMAGQRTARKPRILP